MPDTFASIWFDCDSTLASIEGIDELAALAPAEVRDQIRALTDAAMDGSVPVADVYGRRLLALRPSRRAIEAVGELYVARVLPDARLVCDALRSLGKQLGIVSGGLLPAVAVLARHLDIPPAHVVAVDLHFDPAGDYLDFDRASPLARNGGKPEVLARLPAAMRRIAFVGDGVTDLEAATVVDRFIGFGGVVRRARVVEAAECFADGPGLASILPFCLTPTELRRLADDPRFGDLVGPATFG